MRVSERGTDLPEHHPGPMIEQLRINMGLTLVEAATNSGVTSHAWSRIERGLVKYPEWHTVCKMLSGLKARVEITYDLQPDTDPSKLHA